MKRGIFCPLVLAALLLLTACGHKTSVGIIGGADGPTQIIVTKDGGSTEDTAESTPLSAEDLAFYTEFLNRPDVYGFLLSDYDEILDADLLQVFYNGAGAAQEPEEWMNPEGYGDVTYVPRTGLDEVLLRRTGYALDAFLERGGTFVYYLDEDGNFISVHGDTNAIRVEAVGGERYYDGSVRVDSTTGEGEDPDTFSTVLWEREDGDPLVYSNTVTGGLLAWALEQQAVGQDAPGVTAAEPPFDGYAWLGEGPVPENPLPASLQVVSDTENGESTPQAWMAEHWDEWLRDSDFAAAHEWEEGTPLVNQDAFYLYRAEDGLFNGSGLSVWRRDSGEQLFYVGFGNYLFPPDAEEAFRNDETAQSVRWARFLNGNLIAANRDNMGTMRNAYLTALDPWDGHVLWRTDPGVCESDNFEVLGVFYGPSVEEGILVCGGSTGEALWLYQVALDSGQVIDRIMLESPAEWLVHANGKLYVHCRERDYEFAVSFG